MKNYSLLILLMICTLGPLKAQMNLVPNPSFENVTFCPNGTGQVYAAYPWKSYGYSPDLYCACSPSGVNVPYNNAGFQFANNGNCMVGLVTFRKQSSPTGPNTREFLGIHLTQPLSIGATYYFSCFINCSGGIATTLASNKFGMRLLTNSMDSLQGSSLVTNFSNVFSDSLFSDTLAWYKIKGTFIADSVYQYIVLGNFFTDANTDTISVRPGIPDIAYYFLDDICLSTDSNYCENWTSSNPETNLNQALILYPNPVSSTINIESNEKIESVSIFDFNGNVVHIDVNLFTTLISINVEKFKSGIYITQIKSKLITRYIKLVKL